MKIILSRKGFDASIGRVASPIFPSGEFYSLPIPESSSSNHSKPRRYQEIKVGNQSLGAIVNDLTGGRIKPDTFVHLDPDLNAWSVPRLPNWRPLFGHSGEPDRHLPNQGSTTTHVFVSY